MHRVLEHRVFLNYAKMQIVKKESHLPKHNQYKKLENKKLENKENKENVV